MNRPLQVSSCLQCHCQRMSHGQPCRLFITNDIRRTQTVLHASNSPEKSSPTGQEQQVEQTSVWDPLAVATPPTSSIDSCTEPSEAASRTQDKDYNVLVRAALSALAFYRNVLSPLMPSRCRYVPSCSNYSIQAYKEYGFWRGGVLTAWRLLRCQPFGGAAWSYDPPMWPPPGLEFMYGQRYIAWLVGSNLAVVAAGWLWKHGNLGP